MYVLFNYGTEIGALGIQHTACSDRKRVAGLVLNSAYALDCGCGTAVQPGAHDQRPLRTAPRDRARS